MYNTLLFLHLCGVALLIMSLSFSLGGFFKASRAGTVQELRSSLSFVGIEERVIGPAMLVLLVTGLWMVGKLHWGWDTGWVDVAIAIFALMGFLGPVVEGRRISAILEKSEELPDGPVPAELEAMRRDPVLAHVACFGASMVIAFLYLMTNKPSLGGALLTVAILGLLSVGPARLLIRGGSPAPAGAAAA